MIFLLAVLAEYNRTQSTLLHVNSHRTNGIRPTSPSPQLAPSVSINGIKNKWQMRAIHFLCIINYSSQVVMSVGVFVRGRGRSAGFALHPSL
jgi:hypothetical protein